MSDMRIKKVAAPRELARKGTRTARITFRLHERDAEALTKMAAKAEVGPSTLARLIVERYIADHGKSR
jgi:hypothetical protein